MSDSGGNLANNNPTKQPLQPERNLTELTPVKTFDFDRAITLRLNKIHTLRQQIAQKLLAKSNNMDPSERKRILEAPFLSELDLIKLYQSANPEHEKFIRGEFYKRRASNIIKRSDEIEDFTKKRNRSPKIFLSTCETRSNEVMHAREFLKAQNSIKLEVSVECLGYGLGGVVGRAMLMIEGLLHELPNLSVHVNSPTKSFLAAKGAFGSPAGGRLTMGQFAAGESDKSVANHDLRIDVLGGIRPEQPNADVALYPFPVTHGLGKRGGSHWKSEMLPCLHQAAVSNDLANPRGTVILDRSLYELREERDKWNLDQLKSARKTWRAQLIPVEDNEYLEVVAHEEGWEIDGAIWGLSYNIHTIDTRLGAELQTLARVIKDHGNDLPKGANGAIPHILIHACFPFDTCPPDYIFTSLVRDGIRAIPISELHGPIKNRDIKPTITVILHNTIDNSLMRRAAAQLVGCPVRDTTDSYWIDFPGWKTGTASWLEDLSSRSIPAHDNLDITYNQKLPQIKSLFRKHRLLRAQLHQDPRGLAADSYPFKAEDFILGDGTTEKIYRDLEGYTRFAREFTDSLYRQNSVDDVIIELAKAIKAKSQRS